MNIFETMTHHHQEQPVTAPARSSLAGIADGVNSLIRNPLIARLDAEDLGRNLTPDDAEHVAALVRSLEAPHRQAAANVPPLPQREPQQATA